MALPSPRYIDIFAAERVDGEVLLDLDPESCPDLGVPAARPGGPGSMIAR